MADFPPLPDYVTLRLAADLSSAVRGQTMWFNYGDQGLQVTEPAPPDSAIPLPVLTPLSAYARPMVDYATVTVGNYGEVVLPGNQFSALFWSESAVEKFLLPYYVSAGGQQALQVLHAINHAWYNYDGDTPVVALAFGYPSQPFTTNSVSLWDTVYVIYVRQGSLQKSSLSAFLATQGPAGQQETPGSETVSWGTVRAGAGVVPSSVDSVNARELAEYVSGLREQTVYVYEGADGEGLGATLTPTGDGPPLFTAWTRKVRPDRPEPVVELQVTTDILGLSIPTTKQLTGIGGQAQNIPDSVFWTDGAIEMLVVPYYASVEGPLAPWYLMLILGKWSGIIPTGVIDALLLLVQLAELSGRVLSGASPNPESGTEAAGPLVSDVYGLIHLPDSEWVDQTEPIFPTSLIPSMTQSRHYLEHRTWLLTAEGDYPLVSPGRRLVRRPLMG